MNERVRFTIAVDQDVYDAFADLAHTSGVSLSRCIGDWLRDTSEAAQITTVKLNEVRRSPQEALEIFLRDGMIPEMLRIQQGWRSGSLRRSGSVAPGGDAVASAPRSAQPTPPVSNTGGKSPGKTRKAA